MIRLIGVAAVLCLSPVLTFGTDLTPRRYDIAFIEQFHPYHLRFMNDVGELSIPVFLPNSMEVDASGYNSLCWSPDGQSLAFASRVSDNLDVYTIHANGTGLRRVTQDPAIDESPAWSPDGSRIAFLSNRNSVLQPDKRDIYVCDLTSGTETRVTAVSNSYSSLAWSADSSKIAYVRNVSPFQGDEIFVLDLSTGTVDQAGVLPGSALAQGLQWAPSPDRFLFCVPSMWGDVYSVKTNGTGLQNLTAEADVAIRTQPSWYRAGQVFYIRMDFSPGQEQVAIYRMAVDGTGKTLIGALDPFFPPWSPVYRFAVLDLPNLVVSSHSYIIRTDDPSRPKYVVQYRIANVGTAPSGKTLAYVDAIDPDPPAGLNEIRIQGGADVPGLQPGEESAVLESVFDLAEIHAKDVRFMRITVDPKVMVYESFETDNVAEWEWP